MEKMEPEVNAQVQKEGNVRIFFNLTGFKWEKIDALVADLKFGHTFHEKIQRMAIVGDKTWEKWTTHMPVRFMPRKQSTSNQPIWQRPGAGSRNNSKISSHPCARKEGRNLS